ncbi:MAG: hypothetical protein SGI90_17145 [Candidatus Eisenbacteria bacterium]|nr:hypothetical protein [Candidatus Eisenbacteria bacterium]
MKRTRRAGALMILAGLITVAVARGSDQPADGNAAGVVGEYGISLALGGRLDEAETAFLSQLSLAPQDAGALNNIGNLYFLRNDVDVALVFYVRALGIDSTDAGVTINHSVALMAAGDEAGALREASRAIEMAGGVEQATALMAIHGDSADAPAERAAEGGTLSKASVRALLMEASRQVPASPAPGDSATVKAPSKPRDKALRTPQAWRSAGPRGDESAAAPSSLYWSR